MRLSEAILLGSVNNVQAFETLKDPITQGTCALGAAMEAVGLRPYATTMDERTRVFPILKHRDNCPLCIGIQNNGMSTLVAHLNDRHRLTRPEIAAWVAEIEQKLDVPVQESIAEAHINFAEPAPASGR